MSDPTVFAVATLASPSSAESSSGAANAGSDRPGAGPLEPGPSVRSVLTVM